MSKEEEKREERKEEKKEEEQTEIVLKVEMHCEACARKVARALKGFQGVEDVVTDSKANKVVVKGKSANPIEVYERLQKRSGRKIEIISPLPSPPEPDGGNKEAKQEDKQQEQKEEPPAVVTVVLKVQMHCEACARFLRKIIRKIKGTFVDFPGVESVETDLSKNEVAVKGVVDPTMLVEYVVKRTGKQASVVKEEEKEEEEKKEEKEKPTEKKTEEEGKEEEEEEEEKEEKKTDDIKRSEYWPSKHHFDNAYAYPPQIFSDENPNACSVL